MEKKFYIEFVHKNSEEENYDMQSKWFPLPNLALDWFNNNFDFVCEDMYVFLIEANFYSEDNYDIVSSKKIK